ncbi:MAG: shikimate dehydrogenase [Verrucomicrobia bacterium]|nr:shikimate dehydrogenase [Verrucomicrobiota bacterium]MCH8528424.1 shikimate dehydrogenase [Kiritimatiellia bacterium]
MTDPAPEGLSLTGKTRVFAVLGHPVAHTMSPPMHQAAFRALGMDAVYAAFDVVPEKLMAVLPAMAAMGFGGVNLTIPHKEVAYRGLEALAPSAMRSASVNTVVFREDGSLEGHSTDGHGLRMAVKEAFDTDFAGVTVLLLGCGGAGRAAARELAEGGAVRLVLANRSPERARGLAAELSREYPAMLVEVAPSWPPPPETVQGVGLILNSTALGMKEGDSALLTAEHLGSHHKMLDMTYVLRETPMMAAVRAAGGRAVNGLGMLLHQGVRSFELWTGVLPPVEPMRAALRNAVYGKNAHV